MSEDILKRTGVISKIIFPSPKDRGFSEIESYIFVLRSFSGDGDIKCKGKSYQLYEGQQVTVTGRINAKGDFDFKEIKSALNSLSSSKDFLDKIISKKALEKLRLLYKDKEIKTAVFEKDENFFADALGEKTAQRIIQRLNKHIKLIEAFETLSKYGLKVSQIEKLTKTENFTVENIEKAIKINPFQLMKLGINFESCDIINATNGGSYKSKNRIFASIKQVFNEVYDSGDTYVPKENFGKFINRCFKMLNNAKAVIYNIENWVNITKDEIEYAFYEQIQNKHIAEYKDSYYLASIFNMETYLRKWCKGVVEDKEDTTYSVNEINDYIKSYEESKGFCLGKEQKQAVVNSLRHKISIITGGAGTGKTSSLATIVSFFLKHGIRESEIRLASPTGKASQRMMESINGQLKSHLVATTCHVMLEARGNSIESFQRNEKNKIEGKVIVIDETSMMDLELAYALIKATKEDCRIIFLGDIDQLPPVRAGYFLRDMIESNVPCVKLFEIHRQKGDSSIIPVSLDIKKDQEQVNKKWVIEKKADYYFKKAKLNPDKDDAIDEKNMEWIVNKFVTIYERELKEIQAQEPNLDAEALREKALDNVMIVTPFREEKKLNDKIQFIFNAQSISNKVQQKVLGESDKFLTKNGFKFMKGSKTIILKNNNEKGLINGQIGYIHDIDFENKTLLFYSEGQYYTLNSDDTQHIALAYAITVHKSQGSEWKYVIYCCFKEGDMMNTRNLAYTAVTRAKKYLIIYGDSTKVFLGTPQKFGTKKLSRLLN